MIEKLNAKNEKYLLDMVEQVKNETGEIIDVRVSQNKLKTAFLFSRGDEYLGFLVCDTRQVETSDGVKRVGVNDGVFVNGENMEILTSLVAKFEEWAYDKGCDYVVSRVMGEVNDTYTCLAHTGYKLTNGTFYMKRLDKKNLYFGR